jgi:hypothetical protein
MPWLKRVGRLWRLSFFKDDFGGVYVRWSRGQFYKLLGPLRQP